MWIIFAKGGKLNILLHWMRQNEKVTWHKSYVFLHIRALLLGVAKSASAIAPGHTGSCSVSWQTQELLICNQWIIAKLPGGLSQFNNRTLPFFVLLSLHRKITGIAAGKKIWTKKTPVYYEEKLFFPSSIIHAPDLQSWTSGYGPQQSKMEASVSHAPIRYRATARPVETDTGILFKLTASRFSMENRKEKNHC